MKALVAVKRVIDYNVKIRIKEGAVVTDHVKMSMNPFDEVAVEAAVQLKEAGLLEEVVAVSFGVKKAQDILRSALAMGVDRAILVEAPPAPELQPLAVAKGLQALVAREGPALVFLGKQAIDDDSGQTGPMLAGLLGWPQAVAVSALTLEAEAGRLDIVREIDGGQEKLALTLPAVVTCDLPLNTPRYASLPNVMKARKKPLEVVAAETLDVDLAPRLETLDMREPAPRPPRRRVATVAELVQHLRTEAKVIP